MRHPLADAGARCAPLSTRPGDARAHPLANQLALELGDRGKDAEDQSGRSRSAPVRQENEPRESEARLAAQFRPGWGIRHGTISSNRKAKFLEKDQQIGEPHPRATARKCSVQAELAERLDVHQPTISFWGKGKAAPTKDQLKKLNKILGGITSSDKVTEAESQTPVAAWLSRALAKNDLTVGELAAKADVSVPTVYNILNGRAQNPHPRTISALEKALGDKFESDDDAEKSSEIKGIGELIDFNPYDQKEVPTKAGVYVSTTLASVPFMLVSRRKSRPG